MPGERNLETLLQNMKPDVHEGVFVFCSISGDQKIPATLTRCSSSANAKE